MKESSVHVYTGFQTGIQEIKAKLADREFYHLTCSRSSQNEKRQICNFSLQEKLSHIICAMAKSWQWFVDSFVSNIVTVIDLNILGRGSKNANFVVYSLKPLKSLTFFNTPPMPKSKQGATRIVIIVLSIRQKHEHWTRWAGLQRGRADGDLFAGHLCSRPWREASISPTKVKVS